MENPEPVCEYVYIREDDNWESNDSDPFMNSDFSDPKYKLIELLKKNISDFDKKDFQLFWKQKEADYEERRVHIQNYCSTQSEQFSRKVGKNSFIFDQDIVK